MDMEYKCFKCGNELEFDEEKTEKIGRLGSSVRTCLKCNYSVIIRRIRED